MTETSGAAPSGSVVPGPPAAGAGRRGALATLALLRGKHPGRRRKVALALGLALLVTVAGLYLFTQVRAEQGTFSFTVSTCSWAVRTCPGNPPLTGASRVVPALDTGADIGTGWFGIQGLAVISGTWAVTNDTVVVGYISYGNQAVTINQSTGGSFSMSSPEPFTWQTAPEPVGAGASGSGVMFTFLSSYPITVTVRGTYSTTYLSNDW